MSDDRMNFSTNFFMSNNGLSLDLHVILNGTQADFRFKISATETQDVAVDVWLPRFPPSMQILQNLAIEYSVKATVDPWYENHHVEKRFDVARTLVLKMPHAACFAKQWIVNECIGHNKWIHKYSRS